MRWDKIWKPGGREEIKFGANFVFYYFPLTGSLSSVPRSFCCSFVEIHQVLDDDTVHLLVTWCNIDTQCPDCNSATLCRHNTKLGVDTVYNIYYRYIYTFIQFNYSKFNKICLTIGFMRPVVSLKSSEALRKTKTPTLFYIRSKTPSTICVSFPPLPRCHLTPSLLSRRSPWLTLTQDEIWRTRGTGDTAMLRALSALGWQLTRIKRRNNPLLSISSPQ